MSLFSCPSCGLPAEEASRFVVDSSDGPLEYLHVRCVQLHQFTVSASSIAEATAAIEAGERPAPAPPPWASHPAFLGRAHRESLLFEGASSPQTSGSSAGDAAPGMEAPEPEGGDGARSLEPSVLQQGRDQPTTDPLPVAAQTSASPGDILQFPLPPRPGKRSWVLAGTFAAGGMSTGMLMSVPAVLALAVVMGLLAVAVVVTMVLPLAVEGRRAGPSRVRRLAARGRTRRQERDGGEQRERRAA